ncbi:MAG: hypothetical protein RLO50_00890 [Azospirillaceae bacterium]
MAIDVVSAIDARPSRPIDMVGALAGDFSVEVTPAAASRIDSFQAVLPGGTRVFVPSLPGGDPGERERLARRLVGEGMVPVVHVAARGVADAAALRGHLDRLAADGTRELLLIAGDVARPAGPFAGTIELLASGALDGLPFATLRFAGHPEGLAGVAPHSLDRAVADKLALARDRGIAIEFVSQFAFSARPIAAWVRRMADLAPGTPLRIGIAGPTSLSTLLVYARQCAIGASVRALTRRPWLVGRLARNWTPDRLLDELARDRLHGRLPGTLGLHLFPFGGFGRSAAWVQSLGQAARRGHAAMN